MTRKTIKRNDFFRLDINGVAYRMARRRMAHAIPEGQWKDLCEVIPRQFHFAVKDRHEFPILHHLRIRIRAVALQAEGVDVLGAQQFRVVASMSVMACSAPLSEGGFMVDSLFGLFRLFGMAGEADIHRIRFWESGRLAGVWIVAIDAIAHGTGMRHLGALDLLGLFVVAGDAEFLGAGLGQDHFAVLSWLVTEFTLLFAERYVHELLHQLGALGLVRIVAGQAIGLLKGLILMRLNQIAVFYVVTIQAESRRRLGQVKPEFAFRARSGLVGEVAGIAAGVERWMAAPFFRDALPNRVATEAQVAFLVPGGRLEQLELVVGSVRIVTLEAVAHRRLVHCALDFGGILVGVAAETEIERRGRSQLDARQILVDPNLMTGGAAKLDCGVDSFPF